METTLIAEKQKINEWVNSLEDKSVIEKINELMKAERKAAFDEKFTRGITGDELLKDVFEYIDRLPWKEK